MFQDRSGSGLRFGDLRAKSKAVRGVIASSAAISMSDEIASSAFGLLAMTECKDTVLGSLYRVLHS